MSNKNECGYSLACVKRMCIERHGRLPRVGYEIDIVVDEVKRKDGRFPRHLYLANVAGRYEMREYVSVNQTV